MSLLRYSARRRHQQCSGNADDGSDRIDPISLERLEGFVVRLGNVCFEPRSLSESLRRFKRHPVTNEYVFLDVRNRIHGFANQPPEDIDLLDVAAIFVRDNVHRSVESLGADLDRMDRDIASVVTVFSETVFQNVARDMLEDPASESGKLKKYFTMELNGMAKIRGAMHKMVEFESRTRHRPATQAETLSFCRTVFRARYEANKLMRDALRLGISIHFRDAIERDSVRERLRESETLVDTAERIGFV